MEQNDHQLIETVSQILLKSIVENGGEEEWNREFSGFDGFLDSLLREIGRRTFEQGLEIFSQQESVRAAEPGYERHRSQRIVYQSLFGRAEVESPYFYHRKLKQGKRPLQERGIRHLGQTAALRQALSSFGSEESFGNAALLFEEHYGGSVHRDTLRRTTLKEAVASEDYLKDCLARSPAPPQRKAQTLILELDGCELPVGEFYQNSAGKRKRRLFWKDARCGLVRHLDEVDKLYTCAIEPDETVVEKMRALAHKKGMTEHTAIVAIADGGQGLKEALEAKFHPLHLILDRPPLKSHFDETAEALGKSPEAAKAWVERHLDRLHQGDALTVIKNLKRQQTRSPHNRRKRLIAYLERFRECVH